MNITGAVDLPLTSSRNTNLNQSDKIESPKVAAPAVTEPKLADGELSLKYAEFAKREKILRSKIQAREQALKDREEALVAKEKEYTSSFVPKNKISEMFQSDPYKFIQEHNINGDQLTQALLNQPSPQDRLIQQLQNEVNALKGLPDQTKSLLEEREKSHREQALTVIRSDVKNLIKSDESFELIKNSEAEEEVVKRIEETLEKEGIILSVQEAAGAVESEILEGFKKFAQLKKIQELFKPVAEVTPPQQVPQTRTLTHSAVSSAQKPMNARERAIAMLEGRQI